MCIRDSFSAMAVLMHSAGPLGLLAVGPLLDRFPAWIVSLGLWVGMGAVVLYYWMKHREILAGEDESGTGESGENEPGVT